MTLDDQVEQGSCQGSERCGLKWVAQRPLEHVQQSWHEVGFEQMRSVRIWSQNLQREERLTIVRCEVGSRSTGLFGQR